MCARYRFGGAHFSEIYIDRSIEKAVALENSIDDLNEEREKLAKEIMEMKQFKEVPEGDMMAFPAVQEEFKRRLLKKMEKLEKPKPKPKPVVKKKKKIEWPRSHKVRPGDTLRSLAQKYYNDPNEWQLIYNANKDKIERGQPRLGEELSIPKP
jgi:LysM repeat protein